MADHNNFGNNNNPYVQITPAPLHGQGTHGTRSMDKICDTLNKCGKRVEDATRKAEVYADGVWHHRKFFFLIYWSITLLMILERHKGYRLVSFNYLGIESQNSHLNHSSSLIF
uniref:GEM-like protein 1 n=1 Tax=Rhizophora mucronata TaxID=61149 RepID=A0A2P2JDN2_RHIMU